LYVLATELVNERLSSLEQDDNDQSGFFLTCLLRNKDNAMQQICSSILDLLIAGTDTVRLSTACCWLFH